MARLTPDKSLLLDKLVTDCITFRLEPKESLEYIYDECRLKISTKTLTRRKSAILSDDKPQIWLNYFTRIGFVKHLMKQIQDIERIQETSIKQLYLEEQKESPNLRAILALKSDIRQNSLLLAQYGLATPVIAQLKERLKKKKLDQADEKEEEHAISVEN